MNKPLTIDELKALQVGDWLWIVRGLDTETPSSHYGEIEGYGTVSLTHSHEYLFVRNRGVHNLNYADYGETWIAYKNKEQAESKGQSEKELLALKGAIVDFCYKMDNKDFRETFYKRTVGNRVQTIESEAERRLVELRGANND